MKKACIALMLLCLAASPSLFGQITETYFSDQEPKEGGSLRTSLKDGEFMYIAGGSFDKFLSQPSIQKIDTQGNVLWTTTTNDNEAVSGNIYHMMLSGGFIYASFYPTYNPETFQLWKVNAATGAIEWKVNYAFYIERILNFDDSRILVSYSASYNGTYYDKKFSWVEKLTGNILESFTIGNLHWDHAGYGLAIDSNKDIYYTKADSIIKVSGTNPSTRLWKTRYTGVADFHKIYVDESNSVFVFGMTPPDGWETGEIISLDNSTGTLLWNYTGFPQHDMVFSALKDYDGSLFVTWSHIYTGGGYFDFWTAKIDKATGVEHWKSAYSFQGIASKPITGNSEAARDLEIDEQGDVLLTGYYNDGNYGPGTWGILKLSGVTGSAIYERTIPQSLGDYHQESSGVSVHKINGKFYFLGNLEVRKVKTKRIATPVLGELNSQTGDFTIIKYFEGSYQYASKTIRIEEFQNKALLLKQTGRYVTVGLYDENTNPVWETQLKKMYTLFGSDLTITADNRIVITAYASGYSPYEPYYDTETDSLYTFVLNSTGQVIQQNRFFEDDGEIYKGRMSGTDVYVSGNKIFVFFQKEENYFMRKIEGQSVSAAVDLGIRYSSTNQKNIVFDETASKIRIIGVKSSTGTTLFDIDKNTLSVTTRAIPLPMIYVHHVIKLNQHEVIISGLASSREPMARFNLTESKLVWQQINTNQGTLIESFISNEPSVLLSVEHKANDIYIRKTNLENGIVFWTKKYAGNAAIKEFGHHAAYNPAKNKIIIAGYQQAVSGTGDRSLFIDIATVDGNVQHEVITRAGAFAGDNEAFDVKVFSNGNTLVGGNLNHATHGKAGFIYKMDITPAQACQSYSQTITASICYGESYMFEGVARTMPGYYSKNHVAQSGCDSLRVLKLVVFHAESSDTEATICTGETYTFGNQVLGQTGLYSRMLQTIHGCDSTVYLYLTVTSPATYNKSLSICAGETLTFGNQQLTTAGEYSHTFRCDSTVHLTLSVTDIDTTVDLIDALVYEAHQPGAAYQWFRNDSPIVDAWNQRYIVTEDGIYKVKIDINGCSETSSPLNVSILDLDDDLTMQLKVYPNPSSAYLTIEVSEAIPDAQIAMYNSVGKIVYKTNVKNLSSHAISTTAFSPGAYVIQLNRGADYTLRKVLIR